MTNVTYNSIDDRLLGATSTRSPASNPAQQFGTVGNDAKGQPTQTQNVSHGAPWVRIKTIMVGAAFQ